jgi:hypothetical protein
MADFIQYSDFFKPGTDQEFRAYIKGLGDIAKQETARIISDIQNLSKGMTNEITVNSIKAQTALANSIETSKKKIEQNNKIEQESIKILTEYEKLLNKLEQAKTKEALSDEKIKVQIANVNTERKREAKILLEQEGSYKRLSLELQKNIDKYKSLSKAERENNQIGGQLLKTIQGQQTSLKSMDASMGNFQRNVGNYRSALEGIPGPIGRVASATSALTSKIGALGPIGASVAGVIAAVAAPAIAFFTKAEKGAEMLERKFAGVRASFAVLTGELIGIGDKMTESFDKAGKSEFWTKVLSVFGPSGIGLGVRMDQANTAAQDYTRTMQELDDLERGMIVPRAKANQQIAEAKLLYEDETKSIDERIKGLQTALNLEVETTDKEVEHQTKVVALIRTINEEKRKAGQLRDEDDKKLQEAIAKEIELRTESYTKQRKLQSTLNTAYKELNKYQLDLNEALSKGLELEQDMFNDMVDKSIKSELDQMAFVVKHDMEEIQRDLDAFVKGVDQANEDILKSKEDFQRRYNALAEKLGLMEKQNYADELNILKQFLEDKKITEQEYFVFRVRLWFENNKKIIDSAKQFTDSFLNLLSELNVGQIQAAEKEVDIQENKLSDLKSKLNEEKQLKDEGKANDYDRTITQIAETEKLRNDANKKLEQAQKREAAIQLAAQASDLVTAAANIIEGYSEIPIVGVLLGLAAVGSMIAAFASYKNQISSMAKYAEGTEYLERGNRPKGKDTIPIWADEGERILTSSQNKQLDGVGNDQLVNIYRAYKHYHMTGAGAMQVDNSYAVVRELKQSREISKEMLLEMKRTKNVHELKDGRILMIDSRGNTQIMTIR